MKPRIMLIKRRTVICAAVGLSVALGIGVLATAIHRSQAVFATPLSDCVILLDPGHGGIDAGASANGAVEKEINLEVAKILQQYIETGGGTVYLTRYDDTNTADPNREKGLSQKMSDLKERKQDIGEFKADIFVSIHMNKFAQSKYRGAQVFYDGDSAESKALGEEIQKSVIEILDDGNTRKAKADGDSIYVLRDNTVPSALIECGFLSNREEAELLKTPEYQRKVAWGIYVGIVRFFAGATR